jgi:hypothetical protein
MPLMSQEPSDCLPHLPDGAWKQILTRSANYCHSWQSLAYPADVGRHRMQEHNDDRPSWLLLSYNRSITAQPWAGRRRSVLDRALLRVEDLQVHMDDGKARLISAQGYTGVERQVIRSFCEIDSAFWSRRRVHPCFQRSTRVAMALEAWKPCCSFAHSNESPLLPLPDVKVAGLVGQTSSFEELAFVPWDGCHDRASHCCLARGATLTTQRAQRGAQFVAVKVVCRAYSIWFASLDHL